MPNSVIARLREEPWQSVSFLETTDSHTRVATLVRNDRLICILQQARFAIRLPRLNLSPPDRAGRASFLCSRSFSVILSGAQRSRRISLSFRTSSVILSGAQRSRRILLPVLPLLPVILSAAQRSRRISLSSRSSSVILSGAQRSRRISPLLPLLLCHPERSAAESKDLNFRPPGREILRPTAVFSLLSSHIMLFFRVRKYRVPYPLIRRMKP